MVLEMDILQWTQHSLKLNKGERHLDKSVNKTQVPIHIQNIVGAQKRKTL